MKDFTGRRIRVEYIPGGAGSMTEGPDQSEDQGIMPLLPQLRRFYCYPAFGDKPRRISRCNLR